MLRVGPATGFSLALTKREMATALVEAPALRGTPGSVLDLSVSIAQLGGIALAVVLVAAGLTRTITVRFLLRYLTRPLHLFGPIGFAATALGALAALWVLAAKVLTGPAIFLAHGALLLLSAVLIRTGVMLIGLGLLAEVLTRINMDGRRRRIYTLALRAQHPALQPLPQPKPVLVQSNGVRQ